MRDLLTEDRITLDFEGTLRREVLVELGRLLGGNDRSLQEAVRDELAARERIGTTGIGGGVAFPHARVDPFPGIRLALVRTLQPIEFGALDERPVDLFLAVAGPLEARRDYLSVLSRLSWMLRGDEVRESLREAASPVLVLERFRLRADAAEART